jgi:hypothetical protein
MRLKDEEDTNKYTYQHKYIVEEGTRWSEWTELSAREFAFKYKVAIVNTRRKKCEK